VVDGGPAGVLSGTDVWSPDGSVVSPDCALVVAEPSAGAALALESVPPPVPAPPPVPVPVLEDDDDRDARAEVD
jgi:hypothetical protein